MNLALIGFGVLGLLFAGVVGGVLLRVGGLFLVLDGVSALAVAGDVYGLPIAGLGALIWLSGHWHFALRHREFKSSLARLVFSCLAPTWLDPTCDWAVPVEEHRRIRVAQMREGGAARCAFARRSSSMCRSAGTRRSRDSPRFGNRRPALPGRGRGADFLRGRDLRADRLATLADRAVCAWGRLIMRYPGVAARTVPGDALIAVGTRDPAAGKIILTGPASAREVAEWLGGLDLDVAELGPTQFPLR